MATTSKMQTMPNTIHNGGWQRLKTSSLILVALLILAILAGLLWMSRQSNAQEHIFTLKQISLISELITEVNEEAIEFRFGMLIKEAEFNDVRDELRQAGEAFVSALTPATQKAIETQWQHYKMLLAQKDALLEDLIVRTLRQRESSQTFQHLLYRLRLSLAQQNPPLLAALGEIQSAVILPADQHLTKAQLEASLNLAAWRTLREQAPQNLQSQVQEIEQAAKQRLANILIIDERLLQAYKTPLKDALNDMARQYLHYYQQQEKKVEFARTSLFAVAAALLVIVIFVVLHLSRVSARLRQAVQELHYRQFALDQHAIVSMSDSEGKITYANELFCAISGYKQEDLLGQPYSLVCDESKERYQEVHKHLREGKVWHGVIKNRKINQDIYWEYATFVPLPDSKDENKYQLIAIRTDITYRKQMEDELARNSHFLSSITDSMGQGVYALNSQGICTFLNREAERLLGWTRSELLGRELHSLIHRHPHTSEGENNTLQNCPVYLSLTQGASYRSEQEIFERKDQTSFPVSLIAVPLYKHNQIIGSVAVFEDITERLATREELEVAKNMAESANQAKSRFLANMSHEIRTPMNAIIGLTHLAQEYATETRVQDYLEKIQSSSRALLSIINDILDFSKIEAGQMAIEEIEFRLDDVIEQILAVNALRAEEKNLEFNVVTEDALPRRFRGDPLRLGQILTNLISNAIKFTTEGEVTLRITHLPGYHDQQVHLRCEVQDTGIGMTEAQIQRLFQSFSQADSSTTRRFGGTGLGLAISRQLARLMHGDISVRSAEGEGSSFILELPLALATGAPQQREIDGRLYDRRVLIVDDNATAREVLMHQLHAWQLRADALVSGEDAIARLQSGHDYELVLLDWRLLGMDGIATARAILQLPHAPKVVMMTAFGRDQLHEFTQDLQLAATLTKPVTPSTLYDTLVNVLCYKVLKAGDTPKAPAAPATAEMKLDGHVLLVEDNQVNQRVIRELLELKGVTVEVSNNGQEALGRLHQSQDFDLVFMDMQMPVMDGITATRRIRTQLALTELPIIALTANSLQGDRERCLDAGMNDYLAKPIDVQSLNLILHKYLSVKTPVADVQDASSTQLTTKENVPKQHVSLRHKIEAHPIKAPVQDAQIQETYQALEKAFAPLQASHQAVTPSLARRLSLLEEAKAWMHTVDTPTAKAQQVPTKNLSAEQASPEANTPQAPELAPLYQALYTHIQEGDMQAEESLQALQVACRGYLPLEVMDTLQHVERKLRQFEFEQAEQVLQHLAPYFMT
ncbi:PAS domain S-box-containing protein [Allopseudospirillum japonicum]|uniref:histidine kinase n=1 Tax=Allopseudospirillum japonicum TaxID=64971 RepID=A0A1H6R670_9GAMM|nr:response regulator [Allopseudospirillum japonicum]SEI51408.1 PAS domain S-box-containing protein [Allopseudospirillum japonicum]